MFVTEARSTTPLAIGVYQSNTLFQSQTPFAEDTKKLQATLKYMLLADDCKIILIYPVPIL
jgi:hypothetical protein